ncbi:MAG: eukaryotic-like serine/threonine-protein kinase [Acidimicrobiaceae bacterium]|nr:eukaryotic-like serine/threonine-protein kinase [Acidimicrobiaceae bacterium]
MPEPEPRIYNGRYELVRHVARGGMAEVYQAHDQLLDRPVALKVLFPELSVDRSFVERFRREAQAAANLSHPNIVSVYDWGEEDGTYFIVMEYVDGRPLSAVLKGDGPLLPDRAAAIGADVAAALSFAHRNGVIHRDVKPGNVLITNDGLVKVTDFGIARAANAEENLTQTGAVMGTATYFSPEQAQGSVVDARSDVYSLGIVLYEMVGGKPPFSGDNPVTIAYKHVREEPPPLRRLNSAVPAAFEAIVMQAMAKNPDERYGSADELRSDLLRFRQGRGVQARPFTEVAPTTAVPATQVQRRYVDDGGTVAVPVATTVATEDRPRRGNGVFVVLLLVMLAALAILGFLLGKQLGVFGGSSSSTGQVAVPNVIGQTQDAAETQLRAAGLQATPQQVSNDVTPAGTVFDQDPKGGTKVGKSSVVTLKVSSGTTPIAVPSVVGQNVDDATSALQAAHLNVNTQTQPDDKRPQGTVLATNPPPATNVPPGSTVTLTVSSGKPKVTVPTDLANTNFNDAAARLQQLGLIVRRQTQPDDRAAETVISSNPAPGSQVDKGSTVTLIVSSGPQPTTTTTAEPVTTTPTTPSTTAPSTSTTSTTKP